MEAIRYPAEEALLSNMQEYAELSWMSEPTNEARKTEESLSNREALVKDVSTERPRSPRRGYSEPRAKPTVEARAITAPAPNPVPLTIKAGSPFSPSSWDCSTCHERNTFSNTHCHGPSCGAPFRWSNTVISSRGDRLDPARFPVHWVCGCCSRQHLVLFIITGWNEEYCVCGRPTLQAVYDQFGELFLYWPDDAAVKDLGDRRRAEEAARRLWLAGGDRWTLFSTFSTNLPRIHLYERREKGKEVVTAWTGLKVMC
jgi:hypothetical protein